MDETKKTINQKMECGASSAAKKGMLCMALALLFGTVIGMIIKNFIPAGTVVPDASNFINKTGTVIRGVSIILVIITTLSTVMLFARMLLLDFSFCEAFAIERFQSHALLLSVFDFITICFAIVAQRSTDLACMLQSATGITDATFSSEAASTGSVGALSAFFILIWLYWGFEVFFRNSDI